MLRLVLGTSCTEVFVEREGKLKKTCQPRFVTLADSRRGFRNADGVSVDAYRRDEIPASYLILVDDVLIDGQVLSLNETLKNAGSLKGDDLAR